MSSSTRPTMSSTPRLTTVLNPSESSSRSSYRDSDGPSPTKKRKLSRPPSRAPSKTPARSRNSTPSNNSGLNVGEIADLHLARRTSSLKVLQTWSQLAEKYSKALDEDDIVDLRSLTLHKDRGVVFGDKRKAWDIGCFADASRDEDEENTVLDDDDVDELDAFASSSRPASDEEGSEADDIEITQQSRRIPPVQEMDPEDANDLKEFLEMEEARRALYGDLDAEETSEPAEFDTSEDEYDSNIMESYIPADASLDSSRSRKEYYVDIDHDGSPVQHSDSLPDEDLERSNSSRKLTSPSVDVRPRHETHLPTPASESESDDELAGWGTDEENEVLVADKLPAARSLTKAKPPSTGSKTSAIRKQIPDLTHVLKRASSQGPRKQPRTLTPPSTEFSSHRHPSRTISKMPAPRKEESDAYTVPSSNIRRTKAIRAVTQLATPPLSSSSVTDSELVRSTARHRQGFGVAGSSITGPVTNPPPKASSSRFDRSRPQSLTRSLSESPTKFSNVHMIPEVVIYRRTPSLDSKSLEPLNRHKVVSSVEVQEGSSSSFRSPSRLPQSRSSSKTSLGSATIPNEKGKQRADEPLEYMSVPEQKRRRSSSSYHYSDSQFDHDVHLDYSFKQSPNKSRARSQSRIDKSPIREHQYPERYPSVATHPQQLNPQLPLVPLPTLPQFPPLDLNDHATTSQYLQAHYQIAAHAMHSISVLMGSRNGLTNPSLGLPAYDPSVYSPPSSSPIRSTPHKHHAIPGYPSYSEFGSSPDPPPRSSSFSPERWRDSSPSPGSPKERSRPYSIDPTGIRPRSAMRSSSRSSKTSTPRKVSFSSPEVVQIDGRRRTSTRSDRSREISEEVILVTSDSEDDQSNSITRGRSRYSLRAQTPGPPSRKISR